jgi:ATP-dependent helicase/nuclease subunit B
MDDPHALPPQVEQALARGWTVVTANQRAARTLRHAFDRRQQALGRAAWQPPAILAWDTWTASLWTQLLLLGQASANLLSPTQEHTLWRAVLQAHAQAGGSPDTLRPIDSLAALAADAWRLLHSYRGHSHLRSFADTTDSRAFAHWVSESERRLTRADYLTQAQLPEGLREALLSGSLKPLSRGLLLIGFDTRTPAQNALLQGATEVGMPWEEMALSRPAPSFTLVAAGDEQEELSTCARWMRAELTANPNLSIAVIVPDLENLRPQIDRAFRQILAPELETIAAATCSGPFEFSLGIPLAQTPMVSTAMDILRWAVAPLPVERVSALLLSPHFAAAGTFPSEHLARAEFDAFVLRRQHLLQPQLSLARLLGLASNTSSSPRLPALLLRLRALRPLFHNQDLATAERARAEWAVTIRDILAAAGWASSSHTDSIEFQTLRKWESALDELTTLDFDGSVVSFATALDELVRIVAQTLFAPESRHAPIQIMGPLESAGSTFDAAWFLRAGDLSWPATPTANPLLPWRLQRDLLMPGVDPAHDSAVARRITRRIAASAPAVLFSYARQTANGQQRPSPTLAGLSLEPRTAAHTAPVQALRQPIALEALNEEPPIPPPPNRVIEGGAAILEAQAACGLRAFAEKRLFASALESRELGLDPRERGNLVHDILERFWAEVKTQAELKDLSLAGRDAVLAQSIDEALARHVARADPGWNLAYLDSERRRLIKLLRPWLEFELDRPPFVVQSREAKLNDVSIGPLRLDIRVDRIDTLLLDGEPAGDIILDYKTGRAAPAEWLGDRPDSPQLPLYAVVSNSPNLAAVAFASIRAGDDMALTGYESEKGVLPKASRLKTASLEAQVEEWRTTLTTLAQDFHAGQATVAPKQYPTTCRYCEQRLLCRLNPATLEADAIEDFADETDNGSGIPKESEGEIAGANRV